MTLTTQSHLCVCREHGKKIFKAELTFLIYLWGIILKPNHGV